MTIVTTESVNGFNMVTSFKIIPKVSSPRTNLVSNVFTFPDKDIPKDFYKNYKNYYVFENMLITDAKNL